MTNNSENYNFIWQALSTINKGFLTVKLPDGEVKIFGNENDSLKADITIKNYGFIEEVITGGDVAFGESYIKDMWSSDDLASLLTLITINSESLEKFFHARKFKALLLFIKSFFTKNTKRGSKKNIKAHYDLGNDFYKLWLDESMTYSSALFNGKNFSLKEAQDQKYQNILNKLNKGSVLEVGCGWGGFAEVSAQNNHQTTCLTISKRQREFALKRIEKANLQNLVNIKLQDYREENSSYDNVVSIEMFEAVGSEYWDKYFETISKNLRQKGKAILQIITINEEIFEEYLGRVDFIQKHIFPGGVLPSKSIIRDLANKHGFEVKDENNFGLDYSQTLEIWLKKFDEEYQKVKDLGFDDEFIRKWRFYMCYCIAGFNANRTDVVQFELEKI